MVIREARRRIRGLQLQLQTNYAAMRNRPICVVYGNCQAEAVRAHLASSLNFPYTMVAVPAAHEVDQRDITSLRRLLARTEVAVVQQVRADYRGLPIGTEQLLEHLPKSASVITYPVVYYEGPFPYQVYINPGFETSPPAPLTGYNDLRIVLSAHLGENVHQAIERYRATRPLPAALREIAKNSLAELKRREGSLDVRVAPLVERLGTRSVFTVNHPSNTVLADIARQVQEHAGHLPDVEELDREQLASVTAPIDATIAAAVGGSPTGSPDWIIEGRSVPTEELIELHLAWLAENPKIVSAGIDKYGERMASLGLY